MFIFLSFLEILEPCAVKEVGGRKDGNEERWNKGQEIERERGREERKANGRI